MALHTIRYPDSPPGRMHVDPTKTALHRSECLEILQQHIYGLAATAEVFGSLLGCRRELEHSLFGDAVRISKFNDHSSRKSLLLSATKRLDSAVWKSIYAHTLPFDIGITETIISDFRSVFSKNNCTLISETLRIADRILADRYSHNESINQVTIDNIMLLQKTIDENYNLIVDAAAITVFETITDGDSFYLSDKYFKFCPIVKKVCFSGRGAFNDVNIYLKTRLPDFIETVFKLLDGEHCAMAEYGEIGDLLQKQTKNPTGAQWARHWFEVGKTLTVSRKYFTISTRGYKTTPDKFILQLTADGERIAEKINNLVLKYHEKYKDDNK